MAQRKDLVPRTCLWNECRMVLVGKTGVGKSETGNTIIGKEIFYSDVSDSSVTKTCRQHTFQREGHNLQLIDVPGFEDTKLSQDIIKAEVMKCVALSHPGLHAILFVTAIERFTDDDIKTVDQFCKCFGEESMHYVIVIFTKIDSLRRKKKTLQNYIRESPSQLKDLLAKTKHRYLGVNNWSVDDAEKEKFVGDLICMVESLVEANGGRCYTNEVYQKAQKRLKEEIEKEMMQLAIEERKRDEAKLRQANKEFLMKLKEKKLENEELEKQMKAREEKLRKELENERRIKAIQKQREKIGALAGGTAGSLAGALIGYIGSETFEYAGAIIGFAIAGPAGALAGDVVGGVVGRLATSAAMGYVGGRFGKALARDKDN